MKSNKLVLLAIALLWGLSACVSDVKPLLKPTESDIGTRIATQQKWLSQEVAAHSFPQEHARIIQENLDRIKEKYSRAQAQGALTPKETESLSAMLDKNSEAIFRAKQKIRSKDQRMSPQEEVGGRELPNL